MEWKEQEVGLILVNGFISLGKGTLMMLRTFGHGRRDP
jgi:hypothetical protein